MFITIILFLIGFVLITKGADIFINCTVDIGKKTNISEIILGATIVSFATTLPELTVSLFASLDGHTTMSLGNAVGSIICNIGLLLAMLAIYMYSNYRSAVGNGSRSRGNNTLKVKGNNDFREWAKIILIFVLGLIMMVIGSRLLVDNGVIIAEWIGVPQGVISLTVIALGTSLPELVSSLTAIKKNHHAISVGNILGANVLNIVSVIGISSIPNDIPILSQNMNIDFPFMILLLLTLILPTIKNNKLYRLQGLIMLIIYFIYIGTLYTMYV